MRIDCPGAIDLARCSGQFFVVGVAGQMEQQKGGEDGAGALLGLAIGLVDAERAEDSAAFDESVRRRAVDSAQDGRPVPGLRERERVVGERIGVRVVSDDESRHLQGCGSLFRRGCRRCRKKSGHCLDVGSPGGSENGCACPHRVSGGGELVRMHADVSGAQTHAGHDVEHSAQVGCQSAMRRYEPPLGVRCRNHDAPGRQVLQRVGVVAGPQHPAVCEGNTGQAEAFGGCVDDTGLPGEGQVASEHLVRAALGESRCQLLRFRHER